MSNDLLSKTSMKLEFYVQYNSVKKMYFFIKKRWLFKIFFEKLNEF